MAVRGGVDAGPAGAALVPATAARGTAGEPAVFIDNPPLAGPSLEHALLDCSSSKANPVRQ